jgi:glycerol-3-phosphate dehydrogenase
MRYDIAIIGGGIVGCAIAHALIPYRLHTVLIEKACDVGFGTSKANSGIIHGGHHSHLDTCKGELEWAGNQLWRNICPALGIGYRQVGELTVALAEADVPALERLKRQGEARGVPGLTLWNRARIHAEEHNVTQDSVAALYAPTSAVINPYEACFALFGAARRAGLRPALNHLVTGIARAQGYLEIETRSAQFQADFVINAAGLFADDVAAMIGAKSFTIRPRKGEECLLDKRLAGIVNHIIFPCPTPISKGILVIPTFDGTIMIGPSAQDVDSKEDLATTEMGTREVFAGAQRLVPGIQERDCIAEFAGLRAVTDGEDFIIAPTCVPGFIHAAGIQSPGLTAAPAIAQRIIDILRDQGLTLRPKATTVSAPAARVRFAQLPTADQARLSAQDRRYGHILCRCEGVSEREIIDAIHDGGRTLDGVKFRTRAGMGRCQGAFCSWRCMTLIARETGLPLHRITKRGGGSWLVRQRPDQEIV